MTIQRIAVLGAGSAGFIAALTLKRRLPHLSVRVIRSPDIGVIGVGEGTTQLFPKFFFNYLGLKPGQLYAEAQPTWKLGIRFIWGSRDHFHYTFSPMIDSRFVELPKNKGFYCDNDCAAIDVWSALMEHDRAFPRTADGRPDFEGHDHVAFHIENTKLVSYLEARCRDFGVEIIDGTVSGADQNADGVSALVLSDGTKIEADLFVDASGFRSELLGKALSVPFKSYADVLFCDRAVIGGWARTDEPIKPYTTAETMDAGWCWQIEHEHWINRGYVYSSQFVSDDDALAELMRKNPQIENIPRVVKFRSGRFEQMWTRNVVGVGNASGFVEPLEASALQVIILQSRTLADSLLDSDCQPTTALIDLYNRFITATWDEVRDFLGVHYRFNTRLDTPFWNACREQIPLNGAEDLVKFYRENGPSSLGRTLHLSPSNPYGLEGYLALLVGQRVPHGKPYTPSATEQKHWQARLNEFLVTAKRGFTVKQALEAIRKPGWVW